MNIGWLAGIAVGLLVILAVSRRVARSGRGLIVGAVVCWSVGLLSILFTALPVYGLVLILGGVLLMVESRRRGPPRRPPDASARPPSNCRTGTAARPERADGRECSSYEMRALSGPISEDERLFSGGTTR